MPIIITISYAEKRTLYFFIFVQSIRFDDNLHCPFRRGAKYHHEWV